MDFIEEPQGVPEPATAARDISEDVGGDAGVAPDDSEAKEGGDAAGDEKPAEDAEGGEVSEL